MGLMGLFRRAEASADARAGPASVQFVPSQPGLDAKTEHQVRKEVLQVVMRDTLLRNGIPSAWLRIDILRTTSAQRQPGVHVRFLLLQWRPQVIAHGVALERDFHRRLLALDPGADDWLMGFSWQFALEDASACPPLPHAGSWTAMPAGAPRAPQERQPQDSGLVIAGPVTIPSGSDGAHDDVEKLQGIRSDDRKRHDAYAPTSPSVLPRE
jgi:hypothetical protein